MSSKFKIPSEANSNGLGNEDITRGDTQNVPLPSNPILEQNITKMNKNDSQFMEELITNVNWSALGVNFDDVFSHVQKSMMITNKELGDFSNLLTMTFYTPRYKKNVMKLKESLSFQNFTINMQTNFFDFKGVKLDDNFIHQCEMTLKWIISDGKILVRHHPQHHDAVSYNVNEFACRLEYLKKVREKRTRTTGAEICIDHFFQIKTRIQMWMLDCNVRKPFPDLAKAIAELRRTSKSQKEMMILQQSIMNWREAVTSGLELRDPLKTELFLDLKTRFEELDNALEVLHNTIAIDCQLLVLNEKNKTANSLGLAHPVTQKPNRKFDVGQKSLEPCQTEMNDNTQDVSLNNPETNTEPMP